MNERALLIGMGGLGTAAAMALAMAGVRHLGLVDGDAVALSNLHRQILYDTTDLGRPKAVAASHRLTQRFPSLQTAGYEMRLDDPGQLATLAQDYQVILDGSDNFVTRFAVNKAAIVAGKPLVHGAATGFLGQVTTIHGPPCLNCLFEAPASGAADGGCLREGVLGPLAGEVGWLMAMEAIKILRNVGEPLLGRFLAIDLATGRRRILRYQAVTDCGVCGSHLINSTVGK